ncbi:hypothetical protein OOU_Y34scaffold00155g17 [Pyricularia oryzae Y34]|uniref:Uncharacterized protein n=2 Tax=Pyricularia oryzae TaxID=318829 RepID=A0AA97PQW1_PYRO3|nr:hypothetical protein OOU_Y34scaffold00155g17 [Pyricularia oryzae Y34]
MASRQRVFVQLATKRQPRQGG